MPKAVSYYLFEVIESPLCFSKRFLKKCSMTGEIRDITFTTFTFSPYIEFKKVDFFK